MSITFVRGEHIIVKGVMFRVAWASLRHRVIILKEESYGKDNVACGEAQDRGAQSGEV